MELCLEACDLLCDLGEPLLVTLVAPLYYVVESVLVNKGFPEVLVNFAKPCVHCIGNICHLLTYSGS